MSTNYNSLIKRYLGDVGGSGLYNINTQYYDNTGHIANSSKFGGAWVDTSAYPASDCNDSSLPHGCLIDADLQNEIKKAMSTNGWAGGVTHVFFVFTSLDEGFCSDSSSTDCSFVQYCGYHSDFSNNGQSIIYANLSYANSTGGCNYYGISPNNDDADSTINITSHEQMEAATDPEPYSGWFDSSYNEIGDKCAWTFGAIILDGNKANVQWHGHYCLTQQEWSNGTNGCTLVYSNWSYFGWGSAHTHVNPYEDTPNTSNVSNLAFDWNYTTGSVIYGAPTENNGIVYVGSTDHKLYALDALTGALKWSFTTGNEITFSSPAISNSVVYVGSIDGKLYALNALTGALKWSFTTGNEIESSPTVVNGLVYFGSWDSKVYALNATMGALIWSYTTGSFIDSSSPAVVNGVVYIGSSDGKVYALNATTGGFKWSYYTGAGIGSSPAVVNGVVYIGGGINTVYAINATTGALKWSFVTGNLVVSSPAVYNGVVYIGSEDGKVYALNATTGTIKWSYTTNGTVDSSAAVANGVVYIGSDDDKLYALNAVTGALRWSYTATNAFIAGPAIVNGVIYASSYNHNIYAFHLPGTP